MTQPHPAAPAHNLLFDRNAIRAKRNRAVTMADGDFLHQWAMRDIAGRLALVQRKFPLALQIGGRTPLPHPDASGIDTLLHLDLAEKNLSGRACAIQGDEEYLPFAHGTLDMIVNVLGLHSLNDLPGALIQMRRALKADGLFMAAMFGGETLFQLRDALTLAELELTGGASPRVFPFADKQQMGALMQRAGFALPVVDSELITVTYDHLPKLMADLRAMGESAAMSARPRTVPPRALFARAAAIYRERHTAADGRIEATFEIIFLSGWAPHEGQQKPLRPGSADHRLADVLKTQEKSC